MDKSDFITIFNNLTQTVLSILTFLLGILASTIISRILRKYERKDLKIVIQSELNSLSGRIAGSFFSIEFYLMNLKDHPPISKQDFVIIRKFYSKFCDPLYEHGIELLKKWSYQEYLSYLEIKHEVGYLALKTFSLPFIESVSDRLSVFNKGTQKDILFVRDRLQILNQEIEHSMFFSKLTFQPGNSERNHQIITNNINSSYIRIQAEMKDIVSKINQIKL